MTFLFVKTDCPAIIWLIYYKQTENIEKEVMEMKKRKLLSILLVLSLSLFIFAGCGGSSDVVEEDTSSAVEEEVIYSQDFTLVNQTGVEIFAVYVAPSNDDNWGDDVLDAETLPDGSFAEIVFDTDVDEQYWDLMVEDQEGQAIEWTEIDLFTISELTLEFEDGVPTASFK